MNKGHGIAWILSLAFLASLMLAGQATAGDEQPAGKIKITKLDDLPQHSYPITGKASELVKSKDAVAELARKVREDIEADLARYEIDDATTLQKWYGTLLTIDMLQGNDKHALAHIEQIRDLEDKAAKKLTTGLTGQSVIAAKGMVGPNGDKAAYQQAFRKELAKRIDPLPWDVVQDTIEQSKGRMEIYSENLLMGVVQAQMDPIVANTGELNADMAGAVLSMHYLLTEMLPLKDDMIAVYQAKIDANKSTKADIWAARSVTLSADEKLTPVLMAVWDSGADRDIFKDQVWTNQYEKPNGKDDDGNGFVDDLHGPAYDCNASRDTGWLFPLGEAAGRISEVMKHLKGLMDLQAAIDSPEASALKKHLSSLSTEDVEGFMEDLSLAGNYSHGTHVAGIMLEGNPAARLLIARHTYDYHNIPVARTIEWGRRDGMKCRDTVEYLKQHDVRVVNMSWGEAQKDAEDSLEANGIGDNAEQRREIARQVFNLQKDGLYEAIKNAPDILFICAAGNADNDVDFDEYIPSSFDLPNVMSVGAVDQAGDPTSFTSLGRTVEVCANGFEVDSYVPGGQRMKFSGTSMASPNVANLAGKLLAIDPTLTPPKVIELIKKGADARTDGDVNYLLINPQRTIELLRERG